MSSKKRRIAKPSEHVLWVFDLPRTTPLVLFIRVSSRSQRGNLFHQSWHNLEYLEERGFNVINVIREVSPGFEFAPKKRPELVRAAQLAKKYGATIVFVDTDRLIRSSRYSRDNDAMATNRDFDELLKIFDGVPVATILHPDTPRKGKNGIRGSESKRGQFHRGKSGGRPRKTRPGDKKRKKQESIGPLRQRRKAGASYRDIEKELNIPRESARRWMAELEMQ